MDLAQRLVAEKMMQFRSDPISALVYATIALDKPTVETSWALMLTGGILCDSVYFLHDGEKGTSIMYRAAICNGTRLLWLSPGSKQRPPQVTDIISRAVVSTAKSKLRTVTDTIFADAVAANNARPARQRRNLEQIGIVCDSEEANKLATPTYIFTTEAFKDNFTVVIDSVAFKRLTLAMRSFRNACNVVESTALL